MEGPFNDPVIPDGERTAYRGLVGENEAGAGEVAVAADDNSYRHTVVAQIGERASVRAETVFRRRSGTIHAETHQMEMLDGDGAPVATERARFRGPKVVHWGGELESFPRDLTPLLGAALALRGLEFERGARRSFSAWVVSSIHWQVDTRVEKEETVNVPAGKLPAWRVRLRPSFEQVDKALDSLMDSLMPPLVAHFEKDPPHRFLRRVLLEVRHQRRDGGEAVQGLVHLLEAGRGPAPQGRAFAGWDLTVSSFSTRAPGPASGCCSPPRRRTSTARPARTRARVGPAPRPAAASGRAGRTRTRRPSARPSVP